MIKIRFYLNRDEYIDSFTVKGHSRFDEHGRDIVCAAVSVLAQSVVIGLEEHMGLTLQVKQQPGDLSCKLTDPLNHARQSEAEAILRTCYLGMLAIQESYPDYVDIQVIRS
ncbi:ribosomal-processing cysteine protease Prp [Metallumcola ferriviriculae]|uniref:Ribosomal processing cysteine protease Prp n=1 Tax=Metallumcola ferriviriculae TaxID=3039180 RepID=A0AAU0UN04_9FIRM|nr:ribosomal-processing cysteine protease Prp [Desulfitibacteraceae bacterium MK1]